MEDIQPQIKKRSGSKSQIKVFDSFDELALEIEKETSRHVHKTKRAVERARYLLGEKAKLEKKLRAITEELERIHGGA